MSTTSDEKYRKCIFQNVNDPTTEQFYGVIEKRSEGEPDFYVLSAYRKNTLKQMLIYMFRGAYKDLSDMDTVVDDLPFFYYRFRIFEKRSDFIYQTIFKLKDPYKLKEQILGMIFDKVPSNNLNLYDPIELEREQIDYNFTRFINSIWSTAQSISSVEPRMIVSDKVQNLNRVLDNSDSNPDDFLKLVQEIKKSFFDLVPDTSSSTYELIDDVIKRTKKIRETIRSGAKYKQIFNIGRFRKPLDIGVSRGILLNQVFS